MPLLLTAAGPLLPLLAWPLLSPLQRTMLLLVTIVGGITFRFSRRYLDGFAARRRYERWFLATLAAAAGVVVTDHLVLLALAWTATSLSLHQLLTIMPGRAAAEVAAHKKFLLSRLADLCVFAGIGLLVAHFDTASRSAVLARAATLPALDGVVELAGALLVAGVLLRSAQLPFHGWLIQVMEAPTPVSALLHAGIVNLGAFVLIALGPLVGRLVVAQSLLVIVGTLTAVGAALVLLTRADVKGALAWSTCAQMGFVLLECGLGAYDLALLHLVAHALYKAYAFLSSGGTVARTAHLAPAAPTDVPGRGRWAAALGLAAASTGGLAALTWGEARTRPALWISGTILALALAGVLARVDTRSRASRRTAAALLVGMPLLYAVWHALLGGLVPLADAPPVVSAGLLLAVPLAFAALLAVQTEVTAHPGGRLARRLYPHAVAGFHLDERFTRLTFRLWPPTFSAPRVVPRPEAHPHRTEQAA